MFLICVCFSIYSATRKAINADRDTLGRMVERIFSSCSNSLVLRVKPIICLFVWFGVFFFMLKLYILWVLVSIVDVEIFGIDLTF